MGVKIEAYRHSIVFVFDGKNYIFATVFDF